MWRVAFRALIADDAVKCRDGLGPPCWLHPSQQAPNVSTFKFDLSLINLVNLSKLTPVGSPKTARLRGVFTAPVLTSRKVAE